MIQDLADLVWDDTRFRRTAKLIERAWLSNELNLAGHTAVSEKAAAQAMSAAAILSCSNNSVHRAAALRLSTYIFESFHESNFPFDSALRVILARLGNFPSIGTRASVKNALAYMPWSLAAEEIASSSQQSVQVGDRAEVLTNFQHQLWSELVAHRSVAFSAPTSGGKSFVLELYLAALFDANKRSVVYIVPTRALITQVFNELGTLFTKHNLPSPDIITVPLRDGRAIPDRAVYVMTQERVHIILQDQPNFRADVVIVDEAHSISEGARGILLQTVIEEMLRRNPLAQALFATPTTRNLDAFAHLFALKGLSTPFSREPTVAQNFLITSSDQPERGSILITATRESGRTTTLGEISTELRLRSRIDRLAHVPLILCRNQPNLIYANGPDEAERVALELCGQSEMTEPHPRLTELSKLAKQSVHSKYVLASCVEKGVAFHYGNIPTGLRQAIEAAFAQGHLTCLVCTSTLLQGVNLPAKNLFMLKPTKGQGRPLDPADFWNLAGRAGRLMREFQGNIFLIDYAKWGFDPLKAPKDADVTPAIEKTIKNSTDALLSVIQGKSVIGTKNKRIELETAFVRLFADMKGGKLHDTLARLNLSKVEKDRLEKELKSAQDLISLPSDVLTRTQNVSAHRQQKLYNRLRREIEADPDKVEALSPVHPTHPRSYDRYAAILAICHEIILGIDPARRLHRFHALLARQWMLGWPLPRIISNQIVRAKKKDPARDTRKIIRDSLETIEQVVRFEAIRLFGCYNAILQFALLESRSPVRLEEFPNLELFLEVGASNETMLSFISLGLSRAAAIRLTGARPALETDLGVDAAVEWLVQHADQLESFGLTQFQIDEVNNLLASMRGRHET